jgi:hypothetical protein
VERPLDSGFPGCSIGASRRVPEEGPFTRDVDGDELAPVIRLHLLAVLSEIVRLRSATARGLNFITAKRNTIPSDGAC